MWNSRWRSKQKAAAFKFSDTQGRFGAFMMRLEGLPGNAQGYTRLVYHLDVKVADGGTFELSQSELDRVRNIPPAAKPLPVFPLFCTDVANLPGANRPADTRFIINLTQRRTSPREMSPSS